MKRNTLALVLMLGAAIHAHAITYEVIDLGTQDGGRTSGAYELNRYGAAVGWSRVDGYQRASLFRDGAVLDVGTLGGNTSFANAINGQGHVAGSAQNANFRTRAFLYRGGDLMDLGTLGGSYSEATSLNNVGQVVGRSANADGDSHAFVWKDGHMTDLGTSGGPESAAFDINGAGQIVGFTVPFPGSNLTEAFLYDQGVMVGLGTLGGPQSNAFGINNLGEVVGDADRADGTVGAYLYRDGVMHDLGAPQPGVSCAATAVNDRSEVVGTCNGGPFIYRHGKMRLLRHQLDPVSSQGWVLGVARGINYKGEIVGEGKLNQQLRAYMLRPMQP